MSSGEKLRNRGDDDRRDIRLHRWTDLDVTIDTVAGVIAYDDPHTGRSAAFEYARWTSPVAVVGFAATELVPSWIARTPTGTWIEVELRGITAAGAKTGWYALGRWAEDSSTIARTSVPGQRDAYAHVDTDTLVCAADHELHGWQMRVTLYRERRSSVTPRLVAAGAVASRLPKGVPAVPSSPTFAAGRILPVPRFSQRIHAGQNQEWDGGGGSWCSPTSVSMAAAYWGAGPGRAEYAYATHPDPWINVAAGRTFDHAYHGCGNWPFNTAYAGHLGLDAFVTRLRSLIEVERFIDAGIPLVLSASYRAGQVPGADYDTNGHLLMVVGFTLSGDPVMNDPAADDNAGVRKVFGRAQFEAAWLARSGGLAYVIRPAHRPLPAPSAQPNW